MKISNLFIEAGGSIIINKGRSLLTILGVIIGIAAVTAIIGLGGGVDGKVDAEISKLGSTNLTIQSRNAPTTAELTEDSKDGNTPPEGSPEAQNSIGPAVVEPSLTTKDLSDITSLSAELISYTSPRIEATTKVSSDSNTISIAINGVSDSYDQIRDYEVASGRFITSDDIVNTSKVVVLGQQIALDLFSSADALGQKLYINDTEYLVVGVLAQIEASQFDDPNTLAFVPYSTLIQHEETNENFGVIIVQTKNEDVLAEAKTQIDTILLANHGFTSIDEADFTIQSSAELLDSFTELTDLFRKVLTGSAAISLLVGGIGIMNIMLVSVTERTREIGLRKAVGAKTHHILMQFLTEAIVLTMIGGLIGVGAGQLLAEAMTKALDLGITPSIALSTILLTVGISASIGILFGIYPAMRAAKLNPIDALRFE